MSDVSIASLLEKIGVNNISELQQEEVEALKNYHARLNPEDVTLESLTQFIESEVKKITSLLTNYDNSGVKDLYYKACLRNYKMILAFISAPGERKKIALHEIEKKFKFVPPNIS